MVKPPEVVCCGEVLVDLIPLPEAERSAYVAKAGGAPGNVAAGLARLGHPSAVVAKVGNDPFGHLLRNALREAGVNTRGLAVAGAGEPTALAIVSPDETGGHGFTIMRNGSADESLSMADIDETLIRGAKILHVGTLGFSTPGSAAAIRHAIAIARQSGVLVSADPNLRPTFWKNPRQMIEAAEEIVGAAAIVKLSEEELVVLKGSDASGRQMLQDATRVVAITKGEKGAALFSHHGHAEVPGFPVEVADATGAGDAFLAALLAGFLENDGTELDSDALRRIGTMACAAGAITASRRGAMESLPSLAEVQAFLRARHESLSV